jgi:hypothetical protein
MLDEQLEPQLIVLCELVIVPEPELENGATRHKPTTGEPLAQISLSLRGVAVAELLGSRVENSYRP